MKSSDGDKKQKTRVGEADTLLVGGCDQAYTSSLDVLFL